jgi:DNA-binding transcriptional regulator YhcF (GntR family)
MSGWIKLHRSITEHWLYTEKRKFSKFEAWNDILLTVNYSPAKTIIKGKIININRGESILSLESWGKRWNWNKSSVKRFFELLKKDGMIELKSETITTRLSVCKYDTYQQKENDIETQVKRTRNASETQVKPIKEEEESKEEKEEIIYRKFNHLKITIKDFKRLNEIYDKDDIDMVLNNIENYKNNKNYTSLYLTSLNWLKKDYKTKQQNINNPYKISI